MVKPNGRSSTRQRGGIEALHANFTSFANAVGSLPKPTGGATLIGRRDRQPRALAQEFVGTIAADFDQPVQPGRRLPDFLSATAANLRHHRESVVLG